MKTVPQTRLHAERMAAGLKATIERRGNIDENLAAASIGKSIALGGSVVPGWTYIKTASPSFLSRPQKITRRAFEVTTTAASLGCLCVVDFIPGIGDE